MVRESHRLLSRAPTAHSVVSRVKFARKIGNLGCRPSFGKTEKFAKFPREFSGEHMRLACWRWRPCHRELCFFPSEPIRNPRAYHDSLFACVPGRLSAVDRAPAEEFEEIKSAFLYHWPGTGDGDPKALERSKLPLCPCPSPPR